jgi:hypothetical protein
VYRLKLAPTFNVILFLIRIIISQITNLYYVVNKIIGSMAFYFFQYLDGPLQYLLEGDYPEYRIGLKDTSDWIGRDRYYFSRYFFFTLQFIRLWIFKESYLFLIFHLLFLYYFLFDLHLFYTYCYLLNGYR